MNSSTIWGLLSQLCTSALTYPLYAISFIRQSSTKPSQIHRSLPGAAVILSVAIGYGIPAALTLKVLHSSLNLQIWGILAFTVYPLWMVLTVRIISAFVSYRPSHRPGAKWRYVVVGGVAMQGHLWYLAKILGLTTGATSPLDAGAAKADKGAQLVLRFLHIDYAITFAAMLLLAWHELSVRKIVPAWRALGGLIIGWILIGPGATLAAAWALREQVFGAPEARKKK